MANINERIPKDLVPGVTVQDKIDPNVKYLKLPSVPQSKFTLEDEPIEDVMCKYIIWAVIIVLVLIFLVWKFKMLRVKEFKRPVSYLYDGDIDTSSAAAWT